MEIVFSFLLLTVSVFGRANSTLPEADTIPKKIVGNKNGQLYCSGFAKTEYRLSITGNRIKITCFYKEHMTNYTGTIRNGKIYSNNPDEKSMKDLQGKYYKLEGKNFGVLNIENGDYEWFTECKK